MSLFLVGEHCCSGPSGCEFTVEELSWHTVLFYADNMASPSKLGFLYSRFDACRVGSVQDFLVCDVVLPTNPHEPKCSDFDGIQGVTGAGTVERQELELVAGWDWDSKHMEES
jgi:hypothetical protein